MKPIVLHCESVSTAVLAPQHLQLLPIPTRPIERAVKFSICLPLRSHHAVRIDHRRSTTTCRRTCSWRRQAPSPEFFQSSSVVRKLSGRETCERELLCQHRSLKPAHRARAILHSTEPMYHLQKLSLSFSNKSLMGNCQIPDDIPPFADGPISLATWSGTLIRSFCSTP